jgi:hypothetical protein
MLDYHRTAAGRMEELVRDVDVPGKGQVRASERAGIHVLTSEPPKAERVGRWRQEMGEADQAAVEASVGDLLVELGYEIGPEARS